MTRLRTLLQLPLVLAFEAAAVVVLHRLGDAPGLRAGTLVAAHAPPEDVLMAAVRLTALGVAWWLLATTLLCCAARVVRLPAALRAVEWATLPAVRRLAERSLATALSLSVASAALPAWEASPAAAAGVSLPAPRVEGGVILPPILTVRHPGTPSQVPDAPEPGLPGVPGHVAGLPGVPGHAAGVPGLPGHAAGVPGLPGLPGAPEHWARGSGEPVPRRANGLPGRHVVGEGEHLWGLAQAVVAEATDRAPAEVAPAEIAAYWLRLIEANPSSLRSGDPDLVFPGETLTLPPLGP